MVFMCNILFTKIDATKSVLDCDNTLSSDKRWFKKQINSYCKVLLQINGYLASVSMIPIWKVTEIWCP